MEEFYRIKRLPPYVFNIVNERKYEARVRGEDIVDFGMGNPDMPTPKHIVDKLVAAVNEPKNHRYSVSRGITKLRGAMADWYKRKYDVDLDPESAGPGEDPVSTEHIEQEILDSAQACQVAVETFHADDQDSLVRKIEGAASDHGALIVVSDNLNNSEAIRDVLAALNIPIIEVRLSSRVGRGDSGFTPLIADLATAHMAGFGVQGLCMAVRAAKSMAAEASGLAAVGQKDRIRQ